MGRGKRQALMRYGVDEEGEKKDGPDGCATRRISGGVMMVIGPMTWRIHPVG